MPLDAAQVYFLMPDRISDLQVMVDDPDQVRDTVDAIRQVDRGPTARL